jgi:CheY-like chemotaxis protein
MTHDEGVVLIVEDDADDRELLARAFKKANIGVPLSFATDGDEALVYLNGVEENPSQKKPFIILLDLKLPRRSGFEVLEWIKGHASLRRIPVIILTSSRENIDLERAYDLGANSYLVKPARPEALRQMVEHIDAYWLGLNEVAGPPRRIV